MRTIPLRSRFSWLLVLPLLMLSALAGAHIGIFWLGSWYFPTPYWRWLVPLIAFFLLLPLLVLGYACTAYRLSLIFSLLMLVVIYVMTIITAGGLDFAVLGFSATFNVEVAVVIFLPLAYFLGLGLEQLIKKVRARSHSC